MTVHRIIVWDIDPDPEFADCKSIRDIIEVDMSGASLKKNGALSAAGNRILRKHTAHHGEEGVVMTLERL